MKWKERKEELDKLINVDKLSYEEIGRRYKVTGVAVKKAAERLGISLTPRRVVNENEHFNRGTAKMGVCEVCGKEFVRYLSHSGRYCSHECSMKAKHKMAYQKLVEGDSSIMRGNYSPKAFKDDIMQEQDNRCAICGCEPVHNGKPLVFIIDHIDGNAANNRRDNLRCVCPNCDSQLDTYKSKNKNGARSYYRYHRWERE